jgi:tetratricopeptide (TPR) repeat protein
MLKYLYIPFIVLCSAAALAQTQNNAELQKMFDEDQSGRSGTIDPNLYQQDRVREKRLYELIAEGKVITAKDHFNSAMIFQHGVDTTASRMAVKYMRKALELDPSMNKWLLAAAIDRDLMRRGQPQIYGTQFTQAVHSIGTNGVWKRYTIDSTKVTDEERRAYNVETLAEQRERERNLNLPFVSEYYKTSQSIDQTLELIKSEFKKGTAGRYNISHASVNSFGYELMRNNQLEDALKVFELNTTLYPKVANTFDSYGECLMKLNRKTEGLAAYKKSLDLNPKNERARKILNENQ